MGYESVLLRAFPSGQTHYLPVSPKVTRVISLIGGRAIDAAILHDMPLYFPHSPRPDSRMAFVNEVVSDHDIDKYGLPFKKGSGRYWTRDAEKDMYLWGGKGGNPALGEDIYGFFHFFINNVEFEIVIFPGEGSRSYRDIPYVIEWTRIESIAPSEMQGMDKKLIYDYLKEALVVYADDGRENKFAPRCIVRFGF